MYNSEKPDLAELPSTAQLLRSTFIALVAAIAMLITVILPAEYGIDPTGAGRVLGLTQMGEIKENLAKEAEEDRKSHGKKGSNAIDKLLQFLIPSAHAQEAWKDEVTFTLAPGQAYEVKLVMHKDATAEYKWLAEGGRMNFDLHAHSGRKEVTYKRERGKTGGEGKFKTPFAGDHGWFWRNRDRTTITVKLQLRGEYSEVKQKKK